MSKHQASMFTSNAKRKSEHNCLLENLDPSQSNGPTQKSDVHVRKASIGSNYLTQKGSTKDNRQGAVRKTFFNMTLAANTKSIENQKKETIESNKNLLQEASKLMEQVKVKVKKKKCEEINAHNTVPRIIPAITPRDSHIQKPKVFEVLKSSGAVSTRAITSKEIAYEKAMPFKPNISQCHAKAISSCSVLEPKRKCSDKAENATSIDPAEMLEKIKEREKRISSIEARLQTKDAKKEMPFEGLLAEKFHFDTARIGKNNITLLQAKPQGGNAKNKDAGCIITERGASKGLLQSKRIDLPFMAQEEQTKNDHEGIEGPKVKILKDKLKTLTSISTKARDAKKAIKEQHKTTFPDIKKRNSRDMKSTDKCSEDTDVDFYKCLGKEKYSLPACETNKEILSAEKKPDLIVKLNVLKKRLIKVLKSTPACIHLLKSQLSKLNHPTYQ